MVNIQHKALFFVPLFFVFISTIQVSFCQIKTNSVEGKWKGTYNCTQGKTGLTLTLHENGKNINAIFEFYPVESNMDVKTGSFTLTGFRVGNSITLNHQKWINHPSGYSMLDLVLKLNTESDFLTGNICNNPFILQRKDLNNTVSELESARFLNGDKTAFVSKFFFNGTGGYQSYTWTPEEKENGYFKYKTEGLQTYNASGTLGFYGKDIISFSYEGPFKNSRNQLEMFETNRVETKSLEKYSGWINLAPFFYQLINGDNFAWKVLKRLASVKVKYSKTLFLAEASSLEDYYFVPLTAKIMNNTMPSDAVFVNINKSISFKTQFIDEEVSIPLFIVKPYGSEHYIRAGYYSTIWERPGDYRVFSTINNIPVLFGYKFESKGYFIGLQSVNEGLDGLHLDCTLRESSIFKKTVLKNSVVSSIENLGESFKKEDGSTIEFLSLNFNTWYNFNLSNYKNIGFDVTVGGEFEKRAWMRNFTKTDQTTGKVPESIRFEADSFFRLYARLQVKF